MSIPRWFVYALLGAAFAAVVNVLTKKALKQTDPTLATTLQALLMLVTLATLTSVFGGWSKLGETPPWALGLVAVAGIAAGLSWFFGYRALNLAQVSQATTVDRLSLLFAVVLAMIFLGERPSGLNWLGIALMLIGAICVVQSHGKSDESKDADKGAAPKQQHAEVREGLQTPTQRLPEEAGEPRDATLASRGTIA